MLQMGSAGHPDCDPVAQTPSGARAANRIVPAELSFLPAGDGAGAAGEEEEGSDSLQEEETFREHVDSLRTKKLEPDITLEQRSSRLFHEICMREECWDRRRQEAANLQDVTKKVMGERGEGEDLK